MNSETIVSRIAALEKVAAAARRVEKSKNLHDALIALDKIPIPSAARYEHAVFESEADGAFIYLIQEKEKDGWELCCFGTDTVFMKRRLP